MGDQTWYWRNHASIRARRYQVYHNNPTVPREYARNRVRKRKRQIVELLGGECNACGFDAFHALQVDHRNGGGGKSKYVSGVSLYSAILRGDLDRKDFQLLCANCNWIKRCESNEVYTKSVCLTPRKRRLSLQRNAKIRRDSVLNDLGGCCVKCDCGDKRVLQIDHIRANPGGRRAKDRASNGLVNGIRTGRKPLKDFQLLCANCNTLKSFDNRERFLG